MKPTSRRPGFRAGFIVCLAVACLASVAQDAVAGPLVLHPRAEPLPTLQQGPFVTTADGGMLCVDAQNAWHSVGEGVAGQSYSLFRDANRYHVSNKRALLRTRRGVVVAAWMNLKERSTNCCKLKQEFCTRRLQVTAV